MAKNDTSNEKSMALHSNKYESPRMLCAKFGWKCLSGSGEEDLIILYMYFHYFIIISPWKRAEALLFNKLESPSPKDAFCKVWLKLAQWLWRRRFLNFVNLFSLIRNYLPLEKGVALHLNKIESPLLKDALSLIHIWRCRRYAVCRSRWSPYH